MRVLFDTNIVLDVFLEREPWVTEAKILWQAHDEGRITAYIVATTITDIFYIARRAAGLETAHTAVRTCLETFEICLVDRRALEQAAGLPGNDFEDNLQIACANLAEIDVIVTRDPGGFEAATIPVLTPAELVARLSLS